MEGRTGFESRRGQTGRVLTEAEIRAHDDQRTLGPDGEAELLLVLARHLPTAGRLLDAGGGSGALVYLLRRLGAQVVVCDLDAAMLQAARSRCPGVPLVQGDLTVLPFPDATFGGVHLSNVLHLVPDWRRALAELARVLSRPGGLVVKTGGGASGLAHELSSAAFERSPLPVQRNDLTAPEQLDPVLTTLGLHLQQQSTLTTTQHATLRQLTDRLAANPFQLTGTATQRRAAAEAALASLDTDPGRAMEITVTGHYRAYSGHDNDG